MNLNLQGKVVVVTGGSSGIGQAVAKDFLKEGATVVICGRNKEKLAAASALLSREGTDIHADCVDVSEPSQLSAFADRVYQRFGKIDVWINNAGINIIKPFLELTLSDWDAVLKTNLTSVFWGTHVAAQYMTKTGGVILNTASFMARIPVSKRVAYAAAKAGVVSVTQTTAGELAPFGIRVNAILPGVVETPIAAARIHADRERVCRQIALQRVGQPEELSKLYVFLASDAASYITGAAYEVNGGKLCIQDIGTPWGKAL